MRKIVILFLLVGISHIATAQFTFFSTNNDKVRKPNLTAVAHEEKIQLFNISFSDMILVHTIFNKEGTEVYDAQVYQIAEILEYTDDQITFITKSGVTGKLFKYRMVNEGSGNVTLYLVYDELEFDLRYNGTATNMKTFKQD